MPSYACIAVWLATINAYAVGQVLAPANDIYFPRSHTASSPLTSLGANGPYAAGPNIHGISSDVPANCHVDQAAYVVRHGSRYPDSGAYAGWVDLRSRLNTNFTAHGSLSFLKSWKPVLTNPTLQIAMLSPTGSKEAADLGYTLRTRYPDLYDEGNGFVVWANNYTRVIQTAKAFVQGYLGFASDVSGSVISVTSRGFTESIGNSLSPSDSCPSFVDLNGGSYKTTFDNTVYIPRIQSRLQRLIDGNFTLLANDVDQIPYLCGFESQITGRLSPFCDVFTDDELKYYEYSNDLRYFYGLGPGTDLPAKMMTPFLDALIKLLVQGPGVTGVKEDGSNFTVPHLIMSFLNDGQLTELLTATGVMDAQAPLSATHIDDHRLWIGSRYVTMRGTIAFERLSCDTGDADADSQPRSPKDSTYVRIRLNDAVWPIPSCRNGPGSSCLLDDYSAYVSRKYAKQGNWVKNCNVTADSAPDKVLGASFFTDLRGEYLQRLFV
ncbi:histidine acid phosphatase [Nemania diffusa]|nr:histidine acid phosphatase [Nemania diffusa]